jgi:ankyrin repeat protein
MVDAGFHVDAQDDGATALHWAAFHGNAPMAEILLGHGAPLDLADGNHGGTPLEWASYGSVNSWLCQSGTYPAVVDLLLGRGAKIPASVGDMLDDAKAHLK